MSKTIGCPLYRSISWVRICWLSQQRMAELFGVTVPTINYHLDQIEQSGEIHLSDAIRKIRIPSDKWSGEVMMYNLDVVIAVGYRVNSYEATRFRIWATQVLKEYLTKGFVLDDERLKGKNVFGADYFDDLLNRIILKTRTNSMFMRVFL